MTDGRGGSGHGGLAARLPGLSGRVAFTFGVISLVAALAVSGATYASARLFLVQQRETSALSRALVDARVVDVALSEDVAPGRVLSKLPGISGSGGLLLVDGEWFSSNVTVAPSDLPPDLLNDAYPDGAWMRFSGQSGETMLAVAIPVEGGMFVETSSFAELDQTLRMLGWVLAVASLAAFAVGAAVGRYAGRRLLRPLHELAVGSKRITEGDLRARVPVGEDPELGAISRAFNEMADAVQERIGQEKRFSANVSHELRSPLTGILGTAELLEHSRDRLPPRESSLIAALVRQVRRFSVTVLDLLEISQIGGDEPVQKESIEIAALIDEVLVSRGLPTTLRAGDTPRLRTDPRRFERIVGNLVDNAERHGQSLIQVTVEHGLGEVRLIVDDAGPGVPDEMAERIFEPFERGETTDQDGAGLGLAIVREQVRVLKADVAVSRSPFKGARFTVTFPEEVS